MGVIFQASYTLPGGDEPLTHARIAHSRNWHAGGTAVASTTDSAFFADAPLTSLTYEMWKPTSAVGTWEYNHGSAVESDYCCIGAHTLGTSGSTINVQYHDGVDWVDLTAATAITDDMPIFAIFAPVTATRWRVNISAGTSAPSIGVIKFGAALQMQRAIYGGHEPLDMARGTMLRSNYSETGEFLGRTKLRVMMGTTFAWNNLTAAWMRTNWRDLQLATETEPFFIAWRPGDFSEVGLCQVDQVPVPYNNGAQDLMGVEMSVRARGYD